jgi:hypothetical protein
MQDGHLGHGRASETEGHAGFHLAGKHRCFAKSKLGLIYHDNTKYSFYRNQ